MLYFNGNHYGGQTEIGRFYRLFVYFFEIFYYRPLRFDFEHRRVKIPYASITEPRTERYVSVKEISYERIIKKYPRCTAKFRSLPG